MKAYLNENYDTNVVLDAREQTTEEPGRRHEDGETSRHGRIGVRGVIQENQGGNGEGPAGRYPVFLTCVNTIAIIYMYYSSRLLCLSVWTFLGIYCRY